MSSWEGRKGKQREPWEKNRKHGQVRRRRGCQKEAGKFWFPSKSGQNQTGKDWETKVTYKMTERNESRVTRRGQGRLQEKWNRGAREAAGDGANSRLVKAFQLGSGGNVK